MKLKKVSLSEIERDVSKFQFRRAEFNEPRVAWMVKNWKVDICDPIDLWLYEKRFYLLAGHHRTEAAGRAGETELMARVHHFSLEEAQALAMESNSNRLPYTEFEFCNCVTFLRTQEKSFTAIAEELGIPIGMAKKYYYLRHLLNTEWELQFNAMDLASRAYAVGEYCEKHPLPPEELRSLFDVITSNDFNLRETGQLLRDLENHKNRAVTSGTLFDISGFTTNAATVVKERNFLDQCSAETWWIYELLTNKCEHDFPPELKAEFTQALQRFYAYCVGSEDPDIIPQRASKKNGRTLRVSINTKAKAS